MNRLIQSIYQNCPNLNYHLFCSLRVDSILDFEKLLINCQCLSELVITNFGPSFDDLYWDNLFKILAKSSPTGLFKFKFFFSKFKLKSLKLFFDSWKDRPPMLLQKNPTNEFIRMEECIDLIEKYKTEGIIKKYDNEKRFKQFEWIQEREFRYL